MIAIDKYLTFQFKVVFLLQAMFGNQHKTVNDLVTQGNINLNAIKTLSSNQHTLAKNMATLQQIVSISEDEARSLEYLIQIHSSFNQLSDHDIFLSQLESEQFNQLRYIQEFITESVKDLDEKIRKLTNFLINNDSCHIVDGAIYCQSQGSHYLKREKNSLQFIHRTQKYEIMNSVFFDCLLRSDKNMYLYNNYLHKRIEHDGMTLYVANGQKIPMECLLKEKSNNFECEKYFSKDTNIFPAKLDQFYYVIGEFCIYIQSFKPQLKVIFQNETEKLITSTPVCVAYEAFPFHYSIDGSELQELSVSKFLHTYKQRTKNVIFSQKSNLLKYSGNLSLPFKTTGNEQLWNLDQIIYGTPVVQTIFWSCIIAVFLITTIILFCLGLCCCNRGTRKCLYRLVTCGSSCCSRMCSCLLPYEEHQILHIEPHIQQEQEHLQ